MQRQDAAMRILHVHCSAQQTQQQQQ
jgi:hypothetical protein